MVRYRLSVVARHEPEHIPPQCDGRVVTTPTNSGDTVRLQLHRSQLENTASLLVSGSWGLRFATIIGRKKRQGRAKNLPIALHKPLRHYDPSASPSPFPPPRAVPSSQRYPANIRQHRRPTRPPPPAPPSKATFDYFTRPPRPEQKTIYQVPSRISTSRLHKSRFKQSQPRPLPYPTHNINSPGSIPAQVRARGQSPLQ